MYENIQFVVFDHSKPNQWLKAWLKQCDHVALLSDLPINGGEFSDFIAMRRNQVAKWFLDNSELPWLVFVDHDHVIDENADALFGSDADVAAAAYVRANGTLAHDAEGSVGCGLLKMSRVALLKIGSPWFQFEFSDDGCSVKQCECGYFSARARDAGYLPKKIGRVMHLVTTVSMPTVDGNAAVKFLKDVSITTSTPSAHSETHTHVGGQG